MPLPSIDHSSTPYPSLANHIQNKNRRGKRRTRRRRRRRRREGTSK
jgi:hypothetical protein